MKITIVYEYGCKTLSDMVYSVFSSLTGFPVSCSDVCDRYGMEEDEFIVYVGKNIGHQYWNRVGIVMLYEHKPGLYLVIDFQKDGERVTSSSFPVYCVATTVEEVLLSALLASIQLIHHYYLTVLGRKSLATMINSLAPAKTETDCKDSYGSYLRHLFYHRLLAVCQPTDKQDYKELVDACVPELLLVLDDNATAVYRTVQNLLNSINWKSVFETLSSEGYQSENFDFNAILCSMMKEVTIALLAVALRNLDGKLLGELNDHFPLMHYRDIQEDIYKMENTAILGKIDRF